MAKYCSLAIAGLATHLLLVGGASKQTHDLKMRLESLSIQQNGKTARRHDKTHSLSVGNGKEEEEAFNP